MFSFLYDFLNILNQFIIESDDSFDDEYDDENDEDYFDIIYYYKYLILEKT